MADDRFTQRPRPTGDRGGFGGPGGPGGPGGDRGNFGPPGGDRGGFDRPRFPRPAPPISAPPLSNQLHTLKIREGELEFEVSGSAAFVRQTIDDLPTILARLRGETPPRPASISMPSVPSTETVVAAPSVPVYGTPTHVTTRDDGAGAHSNNGHREAETASNGSGDVTPGLERAILDVLRAERRPLAVAAIRKRLHQDVTAQQVRRTLERSTAVVGSDDRPATYRMR